MSSFAIKRNLFVEVPYDWRFVSTRFVVKLVSNHAAQPPEIQ
jgi:hypothetical protein